MDLEAVNHVGGSGTFSVHMTELVVAACRRLGIDQTLISVGGLDHNRATLTHTQPIKLPNGRYLGIGAEQVQETYGYLADPARAEKRRAARSAIDIAANTAHIQAVRDLGLNSPFAIEFHSISSGHTQAFAENLADRHARLPDEIRLGCHVLPHEEYLRDAIRFDPQLAVNLKDRGWLSCDIQLDDRSMLAHRFGRSYQDRLVAHGLAGLMAGVWHFSNQRSPADAVHALSRYAALVGQSFGVKPLLPSPEVGWWKPVRQAFGWSQRGQGSLEDVVIQTTAAARDALTDPAWRAIDEPIHPHKQAFLVLIVPLRRSDRRWRPLVANVELWLEHEHRHVTPIWVSGNGVPHPELAITSPYWVQASLFYPLPDITRPVQRILDHPTLMRRHAKGAVQEVRSERLNGRFLPLDR